MSLPHYHLLVGEFGTGKSYRLLEYGLELAERYHLGIVANFPINEKNLLEYCRLKKYWWVASIIPMGRIQYLPSIEPKNIDGLLDYRNTVVLLDEAGIFLNARAWNATPKNFLAGLVQVRKSGNHFIIACHFLEQIDKQLRDNAQHIIECRAFSIPWKAWNGRPRMIFRWWHDFKPKKYNYWLSNPQFQQNWLRSFILAEVTTWRFLIPWRITRMAPPRSLRGIPKKLLWLWGGWCITKSPQALLFDCFDSFHRLDKDKRQEMKKHYLFSKPERTQTTSHRGVEWGRENQKNEPLTDMMAQKNILSEVYDNASNGNRNPVR